VNPEGIYAVQLTKNGEKVEVIIDDHIPCKNWVPAFSSANGNELWVILLEKAWAKLHGSYDRIIGGQCHETFRDLTGAPAWEFESGDEDAWDRILEADRKNYIMAAGVSQGNADEGERLQALGLVGQHAYGLIGVAEVKDPRGQMAKIVNLRNPWGKFEWNGDWSDHSPCWTPQARKQVKLKPNVNDGTFWMAFEEFRLYFTRI
jgi:calpain-15